MADVTFKRFEELESYQGQFRYAGRGVGVTSWGMNILQLPAGWADYPDHDHSKDRQEEVYVVIDGSARLEAGGETFSLEKGSLARVGPEQKRKIVPGPNGVTLLAIGGTPGKAYTPK
jgi:mannose-6-phosphate isomerase-like protein (cupin superfamily)